MNKALLGLLLMASIGTGIGAAPSAALAQDAADEDRLDARCVFVKSKILSWYMSQETTDQEVAGGLTSHVTYFYGRLARVMTAQAASDLIAVESAALENEDKIVAMEEQCDERIKGAMTSLVALGQRLSTAGQ